VQYGFGQVSYTLLDHGLLDELRLWVHPFMLRSGGPQDLLFRPGPLANSASPTSGRSSQVTSS
jgi:hypothetical protein